MQPGTCRLAMWCLRFVPPAAVQIVSLPGLGQVTVPAEVREEEDATEAEEDNRITLLAK
jgi:hypothetical protein